MYLVLNSIKVPTGENAAQFKINTFTDYIANAYPETEWTKLLNQAKENGFYK
jgi:hypothetical protein